MIKLRYFSPLTTVISLLIAGLMFRASVWQWERYHWKKDIIAGYTSEAPSQIIESLPEFDKVLEGLKYQKVSITGHFDYTKEMIVMNRKSVDGPGHLLMTQFVPSDPSIAKNGNILVSRGFIPYDDRSPEYWDKYKGVESELKISAVLQPSVEAGILTQSVPLDDMDKPDKRRWFVEDLSLIGKEYPNKIEQRFFLQLLGQKDSYPKEYIKVTVPPSTHFGYTIEWAILGTLSLLIGLFSQWRPWRKDGGYEFRMDPQ